MEEIIQRPLDGVTVLLVLAVLILFIVTIRLGGRLKKLRSSYTQFMGETGVSDLEQVIAGMKERLDRQEQNGAALQAALQTFEQALKLKKGNIGLHRYNAFAERGNDLSFSLAIVNEQEDGMVMTGLHSREQTYMYVKPLNRGESPYPLTPEELKAISLASRPE